MSADNVVPLKPVAEAADEEVIHEEQVDVLIIQASEVMSGTFGEFDVVYIVLEVLGADGLSRAVYVGASEDMKQLAKTLNHVAAGVRPVTKQAAVAAEGERA